MLAVKLKSRAEDIFIRSEVRYSGRKPERNRPDGRPRRMWEDNIRMDLREIQWEIMDWIHLDQDRDQWMGLVNTRMNLWVP
jgi:hypothetical protein